MKELLDAVRLLEGELVLARPYLDQPQAATPTRLVGGIGSDMLDHTTFVSTQMAPRIKRAPTPPPIIVDGVVIPAAEYAAAAKVEARRARKREYMRQYMARRRAKAKGAA